MMARPCTSPFMSLVAGHSLPSTQTSIADASKRVHASLHVHAAFTYLGAVWRHVKWTAGQWPTAPRSNCPPCSGHQACIRRGSAPHPDSSVQHLRILRARTGATSQRYAEIILKEVKRLERQHAPATDTHQRYPHIPVNRRTASHLAGATQKMRLCHTCTSATW